MHSLEALLFDCLPDNKCDEIREYLYGRIPSNLTFDEDVKSLCSLNGFEVKGYSIRAHTEQTRPARTVRIGMLQATAPLVTREIGVEAYREEAIKKLEPMFEAAGKAGVNVICISDLWAAPIFFGTQQSGPWTEYAEEVSLESPTLRFLARMASELDMVVVSPMLERCTHREDVIYHTAVVISNSGHIIGTHRANHVSRALSNPEINYCTEAEGSHDVFETAFGKIAVSLSRGHNYPLDWKAFRMNGAEIIFAADAVVGGVEETIWQAQGVSAAAANVCFVACVNRVGEETVGSKTRDHCGGSYCAAPDGTRTPSLSRSKAGVLVVELDLNLSRQVEDVAKQNGGARLEVYHNAIGDFLSSEFVPQVVVDPSMEENF
eukprot:Rmarinus@m.16901